MFDIICVPGTRPGALHVLSQSQVTGESSPNSGNESLKRSNMAKTHIMEESHTTQSMSV